NPPSTCYESNGACQNGACTYTPKLTSGYTRLADHVAVKGAYRLALSSPFDVWMVGASDNHIGRWNGCSYSTCTGLPSYINDPNAACWPDSSGNAARLRGIASTSPGRFIAVGDKGTVARSGGSCFTVEYVPNVPGGSAPVHLKSVWAASESLAFAVGEEGCTGKTWLLRRTDTGWTYFPASAIPAGVSIYRVTGRGPNEVYAWGADNNTNTAVILAYDGSLWGRLVIPSVYSINAVHAPVGRTEIYAAGYEAQIDTPVLLIWRNNSWERWDKANGRLPSTMKSLGGVYSPAANDVFVSSAAWYQVYRHNGVSWSTHTSSINTVAYNDLAGSGSWVFLLQGTTAAGGLWRGP
ncbi:MAG: hypothetical protein ACK4N5_06515, partial [Myxococcales bacterium]